MGGGGGGAVRAGERDHHGARNRIYCNNDLAADANVVFINETGRHSKFEQLLNRDFSVEPQAALGPLTPAGRRSAVSAHQPNRPPSWGAASRLCERSWLNPVRPP